jgi:hypothetical protein
MHIRNHEKTNSNQSFSIFGLLKTAAIFLLVATRNPVEAIEAGYRPSNINTFNGLDVNFPKVALPNMPDILAYDFSTASKNCTKKILGQNRGQKCIINDVTFNLKTATPENNYRLLDAYNFDLVKTNLKLQVPESIFIFDSGRYSFASVQMQDFTMAKSFVCQTTKAREPFQQQFLETLGSEKIPQVFAAQSFIVDLNVENYGFNVNKSIVAIDVDQAPTRNNLAAYVNSFEEMVSYRLFTNQTTRKHSNILMSIDNIHALRNIFEDMLTIPVPQLHPSVDLDKGFYTTLLNLYIDSCDLALAKIQLNDTSKTGDSRDVFNNYFLAEALKITYSVFNRTQDDVKSRKAEMEKLTKNFSTTFRYGKRRFIITSKLICRTSNSYILTRRAGSNANAQQETKSCHTLW